MIDPEVAQWIDLSNFCQTYHVLPLPGGAYDQDPTDYRILLAVVEAQAERERLEANRRGT